MGHDPKLIHTYQTFNLGSIDLDYQFFHAYLQPELSEHDAWFNVKDNQMVHGVSVLMLFLFIVFPEFYLFMSFYIGVSQVICRDHNK